MSDELGILKLVVERLEGAGIPYMITGSIAVSFYALPRMTRDIDIVVELAPADVDKLYRLFSSDFYVDREMIRRAVEQHSLFNVIHSALVIKVDFIVRKETEYRKKEFNRRRRVRLEDVEISLVAPEDLILSKLLWAQESRSEFQLSDVRNLLTTVEDIDRPYLEQWAEKLGVQELLREVKQ